MSTMNKAHKEFRRLFNTNQKVEKLKEYILLWRRFSKRLRMRFKMNFIYIKARTESKEKSTTNFFPAS